MSLTTEALSSVLSDHSNWVVELENDCISVSNDEGLDAFVYVGESQIIAESVLFPVDAAKDISALNNLILRSHQLVPLSTISISTIGDTEYYVAFGALSKDSKNEVIIEEIETLFANIPEFLELYSDLLN